MKAPETLTRYQKKMKEVIYSTATRTIIETPKHLTDEIGELCFNFNFRVVEVVKRRHGNGCVILELTDDVDCLKRLLNFEYPEIYNF